jgi:hypothetical protein
VEAAVLGAVALVLPAGGGTTAGKEAQAPGAAAAYAAKRASTIRAPLGCAYCTTSVVVFAPVEYPWKGTWPSPVLWSKGGRQPAGVAPGGGRPRARQPQGSRGAATPLCFSKGDQVPCALALIFGRS